MKLFQRGSVQGTAPPPRNPPPRSRHRPDPANPLTWPLQWYFFQSWGHSENDIEDPFVWKVTRPLPTFGDADMLVAFRLKLVDLPTTVASGACASMERAKAEIECVLYEANLDLERFYLTPRINISGWTTGTAASFNGIHSPTPGGRP